MSYLSLQYPHK